MRTRGNNLYISLRSERFKQRGREGWRDNGRRQRTGEKWEGVVVVVAAVVVDGAATIYGMGVGFGFWRLLLLPLPMRNERSPGEGRGTKEGGKDARELH